MTVLQVDAYQPIGEEGDATTSEARKAQRPFRACLKFGGDGLFDGYAMGFEVPHGIRIATAQRQGGVTFEFIEVMRNAPLVQVFWSRHKDASHRTYVVVQQPGNTICTHARPNHEVKASLVGVDIAVFELQLDFELFMISHELCQHRCHKALTEGDGCGDPQQSAWHRLKLGDRELGLFELG